MVATRQIDLSVRWDLLHDAGLAAWSGAHRDRRPGHRRISEARRGENEAQARCKQ
jgi:hypothetical protein